jgi:hypothetical protein
MIGAMNMRLPEESSWLEALSGGTNAPGAPVSGNTVDEVTEAQLIAALEAMVTGDIEYVILEHGDAFLQSAGAGDGPYQLEFRANSDAPSVEVEGGVNRTGVRQVMLAYRRGDANWRQPFAWTAMA